MSKSVRLKRSAASTGTKKKTAMASSAGASRTYAAGSGRRMSRPVIEDPTTLLEERVGVVIEGGERLLAGQVAAHRGLRVASDQARDALPLRNLGRRADRLELGPEGVRVGVRRQCGVPPGAAASGEVTGQAVELHLAGGLGQILDELPGGVRARRAARQGEARPAGERRAGVAVVGRGQGRRRPCLLQGRGQPAGELTQVPRPRDVEREVGVGEVLIDVRELGVAGARGEPLPEEVEVEGERPPYRRALEVAVAVAV